MALLALSSFYTTLFSIFWSFFFTLHHIHLYVKEVEIDAMENYKMIILLGI